jgi:hypothetical protein
MTRIFYLVSALPALAIAACSTVSQPLPPTPEPFTALYSVRTGPYPLYENDGEWLANRVGGLSLSQTDELTMTARRVAQVQDRIDPADGTWLHSGCIFDVLRTSPDQQEGNYLWAYGRVVWCHELIASRIPEPQMGVPPREFRIFDGQLGYFPMSLLDPYTGGLPPPSD